MSVDESKRIDENALSTDGVKRRERRMSRAADVDEIMYSCGLEMLHPAGLEKTDEMARICQIGADKTLLDIGAGRGASSRYLARKYRCYVIGIDPPERIIRACQERAAREGLQSWVQFRAADACALPFEDDLFDIVMAECVTTLLDKEKALREMTRVTKPGGYVGDLEMTWRKEPPEIALRETYELWDGYETVTLPQWKTILEELGLQDVKAVDFSDAIASMEKEIKRELGLVGMVKMAWKLLLRPDLRRAMHTSRRLFRDYAEYIGYGYFVGCKPG